MGCGDGAASGQLSAQNLKLMPTQGACALDLSQLESREPPGSPCPQFPALFPPH